MGGGGKPVSAKKLPFIVALAFLVSMALGKDLAEAMLCGEGGEGEGAGEWLLSEEEVGEPSAIGVGEVFQPKKEVSLLGPGDRGVFVIIAGSAGSLSLFSAGRALPVGCNDIARCKPWLTGTLLIFAASLILDSLACRERWLLDCGFKDSDVMEGKGPVSPFCGDCGEKPLGYL